MLLADVARPRALQAPVGIGICAPSGALPDPAALQRSAQYLTSLGHAVRVMPGSLGRDGYCAGTPQARVADLHALAQDPAVQLIMAARGGFGLSHLLPLLDWPMLAASSKLFCGFSDFTAFHLALLRSTGQISLAGPMATSDFAGSAPSALHAGQFWGLLAQGAEGHHYPAWTHDGPPLAGSWQGTLWGGNLAVLTHLIGTPWFPDVDGGLLFLEDIAEAPYRIERMLMQLELSGVLARQQAVLLGAFTACEPADGALIDYRLAAVIAWLRKRFHGPVLTGLPFGHIRDKWTLPVGAKATLTANGQEARLNVASFLQR